MTSPTSLPLHRLAHGRAGDKGNTLNLSLIAYEPAVFPLLVNQVTPEQVQEWFRHRNPTCVRRYVLPKLHALNFVIENVLDGGVNESMNLDAHGKTLSYHLLNFHVILPGELLAVVEARHPASAPLC